MQLSAIILSAISSGRRKPIVFVSIPIIRVPLVGGNLLFLLVFLLLFFSAKWLNSSKCPGPDFFQFGPMILQETHYFQTASGPCTPIGGAISHAQSLRDFPSAPLLQNA